MTLRKQKIWQHSCGRQQEAKEEALPKDWQTVAIPSVVKLKRPRPGKAYSRKVIRVSACQFCINWMEEVLRKRLEHGLEVKKQTAKTEIAS